MYRHVKYALKFKINIGTRENLSPLALYLPFSLSLRIKRDPLSETVTQSLQKTFLQAKTFTKKAHAFFCFAKRKISLVKLSF